MAQRSPNKLKYPLSAEVSTNTNKLRQDISSVVKAFEKVDENGSGCIPFDTFERICKKLDPRMSTAQVWRLMLSSGAGCADYTKFMEWLWDKEDGGENERRRSSAKPNEEKSEKGKPSLLKSGSRKSVFEAMESNMSLNDELKERFGELGISTKEKYEEARRVVERHGMEAMLEHLQSVNIVGYDGNLTTGTKPFNVFARVAAGVMVQPDMEAEQEALGHYKVKYIICRNLPESDAQWQNASEEWVGRASMSARHRFLTIKDLRWRWFNALVFGMEDIDEAIEALCEMKEACLFYTKNLNWPGPVGLFLHVYPLNSVHSLHIHIVDLSSTGPTFGYLHFKNLLVDDCLEILLKNRTVLNRENQSARKLLIDDSLPPCPLVGCSYSFLREFKDTYKQLKKDVIKAQQSGKSSVGHHMKEEDNEVSEFFKRESKPRFSVNLSKLAETVTRKIDQVDISTIATVCTTIIKPSTMGLAQKQKKKPKPNNYSNRPSDARKTMSQSGISAESAWCNESSLSFAELAMEQNYKDREGRPAFAKATHFVSHAWKYDFGTFVDALGFWLQRSGLKQEKVYFWVDAFVVNQHDTQEYPQKWWSTRFMEAVGKIGSTVLVVDPWENPAPFTRAWVIWELYCTAVTGSKLHLALSPRALKDFHDALMNSFEQVQTTLSVLDVSKSQAFHRRDQLMIHAEIQRTMGFTKMNEFVQTSLLTALIEVAKLRESNLKESLCKSNIKMWDDYFRLKDNLARMMRESGLTAMAESSFRELGTLIEEKKGPHDPLAFACLNQLAVTLLKGGKMQEALALHRTCLERRKASLGETHEDTLQSASNLAVILSENKPVSAAAFEEAQKLYVMAVQGRETTLGANHPRTLYTVTNLGKLLSETARQTQSREMIGKLPEAEELHDRAVTKLKEVLHDTHPLTLTAMHNQACHWVVVSDIEDNSHQIRKRALSQLQFVLDSRTEKLGHDHPDTHLTRAALDHAKEQKRSTVTTSARESLSWKVYSQDQYPQLSTTQELQQARGDLVDFGVMKLFAELVSDGLIGQSQNGSGFDLSATNLITRIASGLEVQHHMDQHQNYLGYYQHKYAVMANSAEADSHWNSKDPEWVGEASWSQKHVMLVQKDLQWEWFNLLTFGLVSGLEAAVVRLKEIKNAALYYARNADGWPEPAQIGLYFQIYAHCPPGLHLHIVDMNRVGPTWFHMRDLTLHIDNALSAISSELACEVDLAKREMDGEVNINEIATPRGGPGDTVRKGSIEAITKTFTKSEKTVGRYLRKQASRNSIDGNALEPEEPGNSRFMDDDDIEDEMRSEITLDQTTSTAIRWRRYSLATSADTQNDIRRTSDAMNRKSTGAVNAQTNSSAPIAKKGLTSNTSKSDSGSPAKGTLKASTDDDKRRGTKPKASVKFKA